MPSSRAPLVKSLDVRRRTLAPHSGEAARMPGKSGRHDQPASQPASPQLWASRLSLPGLAGPCLSACWPLDLIHISHFLACHPPIHLHSFNPSSRDTAHTISHSQSYQHFISRPPATRACDLRCYALLPFALTCCTLACIYATGPLLLFYPSASPSPTRALAVRLHFHSHVQLRR